MFKLDARAMALRIVNVVSRLDTLSEIVDNALAKLESLDPDKAKQFSFLGSGASDTGRASQAAVKEVSSWDEE